jgi:hypothetical protein
LAATEKNKPEEDMSLPPAFPQTFYAALNKAAKEAGLPRAAFAIKAIKYYSAALRKGKSPATKALGASGAETYGELSSQVSKSWWSKLTPEEKTSRARTAAEGRWGKKKSEPKK